MHINVEYNVKYATQKYSLVVKSAYSRRGLYEIAKGICPKNVRLSKNGGAINCAD
jgi:hypothetical protein